uniref:ADP,ATP carrier protein n=1 Tax=Arundo donax TaxID=35708 RepID=A0A0A9G2P9_ARUDO
MMNQAKEGKALYRNSYDCLVKTVRREGVTALWKGFLPTSARLGPCNLFSGFPTRSCAKHQVFHRSDNDG